MSEYQRLAVDDISPDPEQPRKYFDPDKLQEFADHLVAVGVKQPISVRANPNAGDQGETPYMIIAGERRWAASKLGGLPDIPAVIDAENIDYDALYKHQLSENLFRENLNAVEEAEYIGKRIDHLRGIGVPNPTEIAAQELGMSTSWISRKVAILKYAPEIRDVAREGKVRDYRALRKLDQLKGDRRAEAISQINAGEFNSKEFFARKRRSRKPPTETSNEKPAVKLPQIGMQMTTVEWTKLIEKTAYAAMLDHSDPDWRQAKPEILKSYLKSFKQWFVETE